MDVVLEVWTLLDVQSDSACAFGRTCESTGATSYILTAITGFTLLAMLGIYFFLMHVVRRELAKLPYTKHRVANLLIRFQVGWDFCAEQGRVYVVHTVTVGRS